MSTKSESIAVVGMSGRFPQAANVAEFWNNLRSGRECVTHFTEQELLDAGVSPEALQHPAYVRASGMVDGVELFDAGFFGFTPREAEILDPQQRFFLECAWEGLEDAGCAADRQREVVGVFAGSSMSTYAFQLYGNPHLAGLVNDFQILISNDKDHLATRVAYKLNLKGPAITIGTACSTSLVAVALACQSLIEYQCDRAIAGGVTLGVPMIGGYIYEAGGIASPDGHCRPFDASAMGTVGGNGVGCVVLKRLSDALAEGDPIRAVIRGWGLNNDGSDKVGYTAPSVAGQAGAIALALAMADVPPDTITMLEAHGTATPLGDPIEFAALCQAWRKSTLRSHCALGSVKSNVGHMDSAAGVAGLIKCVLSLQHREIPPSLHFERPNPKLDMDASPFFVNTQLRPWRPDCAIRRAAVSSFGIGGTNAHVIVEEAPAVVASGPSRSAQLLVLSARTATALEASSHRLAEHLHAYPQECLADVAFTLQTGRSEMKHRRAVLVRDVPGEAVSLLRTNASHSIFTGASDGKFDGVAFLFPGQGAQHPGMGKGLYRGEPVYREIVDACADILNPSLGIDLRRVMHDDDQGDALRETRITQAAVFVASYALARLWMHWGIKPAAMVGHSVGEYSAATLAGVLSLEDALHVIAVRGEILAATPIGRMLAVALPEAALSERLAGQAEISAVNGPNLCVLSGVDVKIDDIRRQLEAEAVGVYPLHTSHAFHSHLVEAAVAPMVEAMRGITLRVPTIPYLSNVTGTWILPQEAQSPEYWGRHLRATVRFGDCLAHLMRDTRFALLEVGPGQTLTSLARQAKARTPGRLIEASARHAAESADDGHLLAQALGRLWVAGAPVDWAAYYDQEKRRRVPLPSYPFERQRYWVDTRPIAQSQALPGAVDDDARLALESWMYVPRWIRTPTERGIPADGSATWVLLGGPNGLVDALSATLQELGCRVLQTHRAEDLATLEPGPLQVICLQGIDLGVARGEHYYRTLDVLQVLSSRADQSNVVFAVQRVFDVARDDATLEPEAAGVVGLALVAPQEYPQLRCRVVDLNPASIRLMEGAHSDLLLAEALLEDSAPWIAYRGPQRWVQSFEPAPLTPVPYEIAPIRDGNYLITGGLGKIGMLVAEYLARRGARSIVLTGRTTMPDPDSPEAASDPRSERLAALRALGPQVIVAVGDSADGPRMRDILASARDACGHIHGVFHAAGLTSEDFFPAFAAIDRGVSESHFAAKHRGIESIMACLQEDPPDFVFLMSSISAVLGGLGFGAYAAANAMLDATITRETGKTRWIAVNWDGWSLESGDPQGTEALISPEEGIEVLDRVLSAPDVRRIIVSVRALGPRLQRWLQPLAPRSAPANGGSLAHERPPLSSEFLPPATGRQTLIANLWSDLLGINPIGAEDNFFELGGHSLLAIQVISRLRESLQRDVPMRFLFDHPTVAALDAALEDTPDPALAELLARIEAMPEAEVASLLGGEGRG